ncbi:DNA-binding transcriptional regulator, MerR family [Jatrophihabitans endophyticus]|uniref:DNA-binding transcriptional regulator, MerR family n=1 Tax=Jatrophihabitans endophyticus TaxID=1206085 RepID=A0A1M5D3J5_9ACTN|nr:MerR family transcriptional regulator [Jatrophihabitans endophyticus]SHF61332.1 DNA-binding transcriptional regulator, MerR family [Jatrophihabitans endophyticus]
MTGAETAADGDLTVDELAARTGLTVRTVRFYASEGLLPPPERRGRVAYYDARHRMRLELIRTLQEHGYTLAAIDRVLARLPPDAAPAEFAVQAAVLAPWLPDQSELLDRASLERRVGRVLDDGQLAFLASVGALEIHDDGSYRTAPSLLGQAVELLELPVPPSVLADSAALIDDHATQVAEGLTELFARAIWGPYQRGEIDHDQVLAILERMRPLALQGLVGAFTRAVDDAARRRVER